MKIKIAVTCILIMLLAGGCSLRKSMSPPDNLEAESQADTNALIPETGPTQETQPQPVEAAEPTIDAGLEETPIVEHLTMPTEPAGKYQTIHDQTSDRYAGENRAYSGDEFNVGRYERSFLQDMTYLPFIDILKAEMNREDNAWIFVRIQVMSDPLNNLADNPLFGVELDVDINNRGEYLILVSPPVDSGWTTDGVRVWHDLDSNIGGTKPVKPDASGGDGYEDLIFDGGLGIDPDLAWVRVSPEGPENVEIAFKRGLLGGEELGKEMFIWLPWAISGFADQALFEFNDHFTYDEAGSPMREHEGYYPLKALWGVDNTCRGASGFKPQPSHTGVCPSYEPEEEKPEVPAPGTPPRFNPGPITHLP
jgi:hypothetical protein